MTRTDRPGPTQHDHDIADPGHRAHRNGGPPMHGADEVAPLPDAMAAVGRMAGALAHHLNGFLTVVEGNAASLHSSMDDPGLATEVREIRDACGRAERLAERLLSISGRRWGEPRIVDVKHELSGMDLGRFVPDEVAFCTDFTARNCRVWADPSHLKETVLALILNARAAVSAGATILLRIDLTGRTTAQGRSANRWVEVEVADNGVRVDLETLDAVVLPFFSTGEPAQGRGLGLSVAHGLIRQAGGVMEISSAAETGTSVRFCLPAMNVVALR